MRRTAAVAIIFGFVFAAASNVAEPSAAADAKPAFLIIGNDEKVTFDDAGKTVVAPPGKDSVSILDVAAHPDAPTIVATLPLANTIIGPPTNVAITPDQKLALVASSMSSVQDGEAWKLVPDNKLFVIDLTASPPAQVGTVDVGKQPSGLAINARGDLALVANRNDKSISVLSIAGKEVKLVGTVPIEDEVAAVAITPDSKLALAVKFGANKVAVLKIDGTKVTYDKADDLPVGLWPYNIDITPNGQLALVANNGNAGKGDGHVDTVSVIDLSPPQPRVIDHVAIGDGPEGFAISPKGDLAVAMLLGGGNMPKNHWAYVREGTLVLLKIAGKQVTKVGHTKLGALPEGVAFSQDGKYLYTSDYVDGDLWVFRVTGTRVTDTGKRVKLPGHPASMRAGSH